MHKDDFEMHTNNIKEVLSNMPVNNRKNKSKYLEYILEQLDIFTKERDILYNEIVSRVKTIKAKERNNVISFDDIDKKIEELRNELLIFNQFNSPYEKIDMDRIIYEINHYYKDNLDALNEDIRDAIKCFQTVGVNLTIQDFCYSEYVNKYMSVILCNDNNSKDIKKRLDDVYWKSPSVMKQIASNFDYLYYKYEKYFVRYYQNKEKEILLGKKYKDICCEYCKFIRDKDIEEYDINNVVKLIMNNSINIKDYSEDKLKSYEDSISSGSVDMENYIELYYSLLEYKVYKEYGFIIDKIKELFQNRNQYKNQYKNIKKEIDRLERNLFKINKKIRFQDKYFKNQKKRELLELEVNKLTDSLNLKYNELHEGYVNEKISLFNAHVSYYDVLRLVVSNYVYFRRLVLDNQEGISDKEILESRDFLSRFLLNDNLHFLPNIMIMDDVNISQIIGDKYKLLNINISDEEIDSNTDGYMEIIKKILIINSINTSNITYDELLFQWNTKDIVKDN